MSIKELINVLHDGSFYDLVIAIIRLILYSTVVCLFSWRYNPFGCILHSPVAGFGILIFEVSRSHTSTRHSR